MSIINYIPNYDGDITAIPTAGIDPLTENDIRIDKYKQYALEHLEVLILNANSWGSEWWIDEVIGELSSSTSPEYPMAEIDVVDPTDNDALIIAHILDPMLKNHLPGSKSGPIMTSENYLSLSSHGDLDIPGDLNISSSTSI
jgi:hypothetical protein